MLSPAPLQNRADPRCPGVVTSCWVLLASPSRVSIGIIACSPAQGSPASRPDLHLHLKAAGEEGPPGTPCNRLSLPCSEPYKPAAPRSSPGPQWARVPGWQDPPPLPGTCVCPISFAYHLCGSVISHMGINQGQQ